MRSSRPGLDTPAGQESEILQDVVKSCLPVVLITFSRSQRFRDAQPGILNGRHALLRVRGNGIWCPRCTVR